MFLYLILNKIIIAYIGVKLRSYQKIDRLREIYLTELSSMVKSAYYNCVIDVMWNGINNSEFIKVVIIYIMVMSALCILIYVWKAK